MSEIVRPHGRRIGKFALFRGLAAFALLTTGLLIAASPAAAATGSQTAVSPWSGAHTIAATTTCNNGVGGGGGKGVICEVMIANTITVHGGSAVVTVHECLGSAGAPLSGVCSTTTLSVASAVTTVNQCNGTVEGGGSTLRCSVVITNNFVGVAPGSKAASVDQCVGSGGGIVTGCSPLQSTTSAAITQCNSSANGGTLVQLTCTATGQSSSALPITINQCNNSANGGGSLVICSASMTNATRTGGSTPPPTSTVSQGSRNNSIPPLAGLLLGLALILGGLSLAAFELHRRSVRI